MKNPIIQEVRDAREALAARFDFELHPFLAAVPHQEPDETDRLPE